jgi:hypothetical protein
MRHECHRSLIRRVVRRERRSRTSPALVTVLLSTYAHCIDGQDEITNRQIEHVLNTQNRRSNRTTSGATDRRSRPDPVRHMSASGS